MDNLTVAALTLASAIFSGFGVTLFTSFKDNKKEKIRQAEREHDHLIIELKDLQIKLYKIEQELYEWKDKYFDAIQELISVKAELEQALIKLTHIEIHKNEG
jgi:peptidoglycan hydrolase CwlO-like protein